MTLNRIYFSPTGGTEKAMGLLSAPWGEDVHDIDLSVAGGEYGAFGEARPCLIAVPSFGGRVPAPALARLGQLRGRGAPAALLVTYGNRAYDDTLLELQDAAEGAGFHTVAAVAAVAQHSILHQFATGRPDAADAQRLGEYALAIRSALEADAPCQPPVLPGSRPFRAYHGVPFVPEVDKHCTGCGLCAARCPVGAILPGCPAQTQKAQCISCMRCIAICPQHARRLNPAVVFVAGKKLERACATRKEPALFLGAPTEARP